MAPSLNANGKRPAPEHTYDGRYARSYSPDMALSLNAKGKRHAPGYTYDRSYAGSHHNSQDWRPESSSTNASLSARSIMSNNATYTHFAGQLATPGASAQRTMAPTVPLKIEIPKRILSQKEQHQIAVRKAAARNWEKSGKLQRPEPNKKEIKDAYNMKLLRHYPARQEDSGPDTTTTSQEEPGPSTTKNSRESKPAGLQQAPRDNFIRPVIQKSPRVTALLNAFPALSTTTPPSLLTRQLQVDYQIGARNLERNRWITGGPDGQQMAWECFSRPDRPEREVMVESALPIHDLHREHAGLPNRLPDWKKYQTGPWAMERQTVSRKRLP